jgi:hypothetical protein
LITDAHGSFNTSLIWFFTFVWCSGLGASALLLVCVYALKKHWKSEVVSPEAMHHDRQVYKNGETILAERSLEVFLDRLLCDFSCSADLLVHVKRFKNFLEDENNRYLALGIQKRAGVLAVSLQSLIFFIDEHFKMSNEAPVLNDIQLRLRSALLVSPLTREACYRAGDKRKVSWCVGSIKRHNRAYRAAVKDTLHV